MNHRSRTIRILLAATITVTAALATASCDDSRAYDSAQPVDVDGWERQDSLVYAVGRLPRGTYRMTLSFRATGSYPFRELGFTITTRRLPSGKTTTKRVKCAVFDDQGQPAGTRGISSNSYIYNVGTLTAQPTDSVTVTVTHDMIQTKIPGITGVGLTLKR